jgi:hypothetical protein
LQATLEETDLKDDESAGEEPKEVPGVNAELEEVGCCDSYFLIDPNRIHAVFNLANFYLISLPFRISLIKVPLYALATIRL